MVLLCAALVISIVLCWPLRTRDIPLEKLMVDTSMFPPGWQLASTYSLGKEDANGARENLVRVWEMAQSESEPIPGSFMTILKYDHVLSAMYWYAALTAGNSLPFEVFRSPDKWSYRSGTADQMRVVCSLPSAGTYCRIYARYGKYVVLFQLDDRSSTKIESDFQALWEKIDAQVGERLAR